MTRQEYKDKLIKGHEQTISVAMNIALTIDKIFDDLESRVCGNCIYCKRIEEERINICINKENEYMNGLCSMQVDENFGCNRFEKRREND